MVTTSLILIFVAFLLSALLTAVEIPILRRLKFGQSILQIGPSWHNKKSGTPTMGGISFIISILITIIIAISMGKFQITTKSLCIFIFAFAFGCIGFLDDFIKVVLKRNLGLRASQKFGLQLIIAAIGTCFLYFGGFVPSSILIPFTHFAVNLGLWFIPFTIIVILAVVNAVNLTDGIDGLATSVTTIVCLFFAVTAYTLGDNGTYSIAIIIVGALLGFLIFNANPAKVFMGDTGSLFLGGLVAFFAIAISNPLIIILVGLIYLIETLSVILQVLYFKATHGKRIFLMTPIHHHFEKLGWKETKITTIFTIVTIITCALALFGI